MECRFIDPRDRDAVDAFHRVYIEVGTHDAPRTFVPGPVEQVVELLLAGTERFGFTGVLGFEADELVATGLAIGYRLDNLEQMNALVRVRPAHRRRGYGSQMLLRLEAFAQRDGRRVLNASGRWATGVGVTGAGSAAAEFCAAHGFTLGQTEVIRLLALPMDRDRVGVGPTHPLGYEVRAWAGPVPEEIVQQWAELEAGVSADAPSGDLAGEPETASVAAVRSEERLLEVSRQTAFSAVALGPDGNLAAYTTMVVQSDASVPARQGGTFVRGADRGHGLGLAVKLAVLELIQRVRPDIPATIAQNAVANHHMVAINDALGYVPVEYIGAFQKFLTPIFTKS